MKLRPLIPALVAAAAFAAGCGDEIDRANDTIDRSQEQVDRARDAVEDPAGAAEREIDKALEDAVTPEDQP